ncbi:hypothetical protein PsYK624_087960 [Phanerochaete sordida]|uniref:Uncharacterized protein n=1 Tax=Phanerochaete sordida TaxID=48140 RepID=A0A9P3GD87_9APHY|nr:hypothetical protein PsYK624_087960 [Phanerochaete sordida]
MDRCASCMYDHPLKSVNPVPVSTQGACRRRPCLLATLVRTCLASAALIMKRRHLSKPYPPLSLEVIGAFLQAHSSRIYAECPSLIHPRWAPIRDKLLLRLLLRRL